MDLEFALNVGAATQTAVEASSSFLPKGAGGKLVKSLWGAFKYPLGVMLVIFVIRMGGASLWKALWNSLR